MGPASSAIRKFTGVLMLHKEDWAGEAAKPRSHLVRGFPCLLGQTTWPANPGWQECDARDICTVASPKLHRVSCSVCDQGN